MTQQMQIALDPQLGLTPEAFVAAWNEHDAALQAGRVGLSQTIRSTFDPTIAALLLTTATTIATSVLTALISDIVIKASQPKQKPEISQQTLATAPKSLSSPSANPSPNIVGAGQRGTDSAVHQHLLSALSRPLPKPP